MAQSIHQAADAEAAVHHLADWRPYPFTVEETRLDVRLAPRATRIRSSLDIVPVAGPADLVLDGAGLRTIWLALNDQPLPLSLLPAEGEQLVVPAAMLPEGPFTFSAEVEVDPQANTALEGLYLSAGLYCTQCEAEGFRRITWYPDRPDVMAPFRVRLEADEPVLLSNGNPVADGPGWAEWHDPWPKPAYLFAMVAGTLEAVSDRFTTVSGRDILLNVWVRPDDIARADFAMDALQRAMRWDERVYGREYDLDVFNIVAVDDFNMGAMENKGLNIFNSRLVLASPETATDADYERIEAVIAHEYFHNWTGNRITCRDWFQLCLKEGLTVFRDQQFTSDVRSAAVKRIEDVKLLRARQFREDQGPLAHPPRPDHYQEINNFYTATVYEKGAEVIGMLKRLVGDAEYAEALDLYFNRHDGQACTIEDWLTVFEDATGRDFSQFKRWYTDAGTPHLTLVEEWDESDGRLTLCFAQSTAPTPGQPVKEPRVIPVAVGLISPNGDEVLPTTILEMTEAEQKWSFDGLGARPAVSLLRGFSAPVTVGRSMSPQDRAVLLAHDTDSFARWEAGRDLVMDSLVAVAQGGDADPALIEAIGALLADSTLDPAFAALVLRLPAEDEVAAEIVARGGVPDPDRIHSARRSLAADIAAAHETVLDQLYREMSLAGPYAPGAADAGARSLRLAALSLLSRLDGGDRAQALWQSAGNMTEGMGALTELVRLERAGDALAGLEAQFGGNRLVMDKFFAVQVAAAPPDRALATARQLAMRPDFDWKNPNRFRSLVGGFGGNHAAFHAADGEGYAFVAEWLARLDPLNPQTAARMTTMFETWPHYDAGRRAAARAVLERLSATPDLSRNTGEMVSRLLSAEDRGGLHRGK